MTLMMNKPRVVAVALRKDGVVVTMERPARHHNLISEMGCLGVLTLDWEQGFLSSEGEFLTRYTARKIALRAGQCSKTLHADELFSEDVW